MWNISKWIVSDKILLNLDRDKETLEKTQPTDLEPSLEFDQGTGGYTPDGAWKNDYCNYRIYDNEKFGELIFGQYKEKFGIQSLGRCPDPNDQIPEEYKTAANTENNFYQKFSGIFYLLKYKDYTQFPLYMGPPGTKYESVLSNETPSCIFPKCIQTAFKSKIFISKNIS